MWTRDATKAVVEDGHKYDSTLEYNVKVGLERMDLVMGRDFGHHHRVQGVKYYEPDFTIYRAPEEFEFPAYIEVKPADALYELRDHFGLPERFTTVEEFWMTEAMLNEVVDELWKPKRLAEQTGCEVLVTSKVNGNSTLSAILGPETVTLNRLHPGVNWPGHKDRVKRQLDDIYWANKNAERVAQQRAEEAQRIRHLREFFAAVGLVDALYPGTCWECDQWREPVDLYRAARKTDDGRWALTCREHVD
jgi:hypothetical protein